MKEGKKEGRKGTRVHREDSSLSTSHLIFTAIFMYHQNQAELH